jgi:death on curing protein
MTKFLSAEYVLALHEDLLGRWGGEEGGGHRGATYEGADAAVQAVKNSYYETLEELGAAYAVYIVQGHVFLDGNKRTGAAALATFLDANGLQPRISPKKLFEAMLELQSRAEQGERTDRLIAWLSKKL